MLWFPGASEAVSVPLYPLCDPGDLPRGQRGPQYPVPNEIAESDRNCSAIVQSVHWRVRSHRV